MGEKTQFWIAYSPLLNQSKPINSSHRLDEIATQVQMHAIELVGLDTHVPRSQMIQPPLSRLLPHRLLKDLQRLIALGDDPLVRFERAGGIGADEEPGPGRARFGEVRCRGDGVGIDAVEPVDRRLEIEVVPEPVPEDEGVWSEGFGGG